MIKKLYAGALALAGFSSAAELTDEQKSIMCVQYPSEWNKFDLRALESSSGYNSQGVDFNFCEYLPQSSYFADMKVSDNGVLHTEILTSSDPLPDFVSEIIVEDKV